MGLFWHDHLFWDDGALCWDAGRARTALPCAGTASVLARGVVPSWHAPRAGTILAVFRTLTG
eukprot:849531-Prymnesium_polylepis.1